MDVWDMLYEESRKATAGIQMTPANIDYISTDGRKVECGDGNQLSSIRDRKISLSDAQRERMMVPVFISFAVFGRDKLFQDIFMRISIRQK